MIYLSLLKNIFQLKTSRLIIRQWKQDDYAPFPEVNLDPDVMQYFPNTLSHKESDVFSKKIVSFIEKNGWGMCAAELKSTGKFYWLCRIKYTKA